MIIDDYRDGLNRFEIKGILTPKKHATLQNYYDTIGSTVNDYKIVISIRHPFERAVSFYFSPHRWLKQGLQGCEFQTPYWDENEFFDLLNNDWLFAV